MNDTWKKRTWKMKKILFPKSVLHTFGTFGAVLLISSCMLGLLGLFVVTNALITIPLIVGMVVKGDDVAVVGEKKGAVDKVKGFWTDSTPARKGFIVTALGLAIPFILLGGMWLMTVGTAFAMDVVIILPLLLIVGYAFYRKPERQGSSFGKVLGNPIMGVIGIVGLAFILIMTGITYTEVHKYDGARADMDEYVQPLFTTSNDTEVISSFDNSTGLWTNTTVSKSVEKILFKVVDDFFEESGLSATVVTDSTWTNETANSGIGGLNLVETSGSIPVNWARVSLSCLDKETGTEILHVGGITDSTGLILFNDVPYGIYDIVVDAGGYKKFGVEVHIDETYEAGTVYIHMRPIYYKVRVNYAWLYSVDVTADGFWVDKSELRGQAIANTEWLGGISKGDWDLMKRTNSWYGWSGIPTPGLTNSILTTKQSVNQIYNSYMVFLNNMIIPPQTWGYGLGGFESEDVPDFLEDETYFKHWITVQPFPYSSAVESGFEGGSTAQAVYVTQIPTPNLMAIDLTTLERDEIAQESENNGLYDDFVDDIATAPEDFGDAMATISGAETGGDTVATSDIHGGSIALSRSYDYVVWSPASEGSTIHIQWNITTMYTDVDKTIKWFSNPTEVHQQYSYIDLTFDFINELPTVETPPIGG